MRKIRSNRLGIKGTLTARVRKSPRHPWVFLWEKPIKNLITNVGLGQVALLWGDGTALAFTKGNIGTGTNAPAVDQEALQTQVDSQTGTFSRETTTITNDTAKLISLHTAPSGGWAITEYGAFNTDGTPTMYNRVTFSAINLAETEQLQFTYKTCLARI